MKTKHAIFVIVTIAVLAGAILPISSFAMPNTVQNHNTATSQEVDDHNTEADLETNDDHDTATEGPNGDGDGEQNDSTESGK